MQLKGIINNMAAKTGIKANALLQNYMLERLLERIFVSEYLKRKDRNLEKLLEYAEICRIEPLLQTWLNAII